MGARGSTPGGSLQAVGWGTVWLLVPGLPVPAPPRPQPKGHDTAFVGGCIPEPLSLTNGCWSQPGWPGGRSRLFHLPELCLNLSPQTPRPQLLNHFLPLLLLLAPPRGAPPGLGQVQGRPYLTVFPPLLLAPPQGPDHPLLSGATPILAGGR